MLYASRSSAVTDTGDTTTAWLEHGDDPIAPGYYLVVRHAAATEKDTKTNTDEAEAPPNVQRNARAVPPVVVIVVGRQARGHSWARVTICYTQRRGR